MAGELHSASKHLHFAAGHLGLCVTCAEMTQPDVLRAAEANMLQEQSCSKGNDAAKSDHAAKLIMHGGLHRHSFCT